MSDKKVRKPKETIASLKKQITDLEQRNKILSESNSDLIPLAAETDAVREQLRISRDMVKEAKEAYGHYKQKSYKNKSEAEQFLKIKSAIEILLAFATNNPNHDVLTADKVTLVFLKQMIDG
jgi:hypothetical protein